MAAPASPPVFERAAVRVQQRVLLRRYVSELGKTGPWIIAGMLGCIAARWFAGIGIWLPVTVLVAWLGLAAFVVWRTRPGKYESLAFWDATGGRSEAFAAAWWFERRAGRTEAEDRHLAAQRDKLAAALKHLRSDLPLVVRAAVWITPLLAALAIGAGMLRPGAPADSPLTDAMQKAAAREASALKQQAAAKKKLEGLTEQERQEIDKLRDAVKATAESIEKGGADSARSVLGELEKRARDAERLAEKLGKKGDAWASDALVDQLRRHADTADLGDAVAAKKAAQAAQAAAELARKLTPPQLNAEAADRMKASMADVGRSAEEEDRQRLVGQNVLAAADELAANRPPAAAVQFDRLAQKLAEAARREEAQREMEKLAGQLREAGSRITGQENGGLSKMAESGQSGSPQAQGQQSEQASSSAQQKLQAPGLAQPSQMLQSTPGTQGGQQQSMTMTQGQVGAGMTSPTNPGQNQQGKPMLLAPIPGAKPDQQPSAIVIAPNLPPSDAAGSTTLTVPGGSQAGNGTAKMDGAKTAQTKAGNASQVSAQSGSDGSSSVRAVEGAARTEQAAQQSANVTVEFIKQQEAALDEAALPQARREQVRRYFDELRKRFENN